MQPSFKKGRSIKINGFLVKLKCIIEVIDHPPLKNCVQAIIEQEKTHNQQ